MNEQITAGDKIIGTLADATLIAKEFRAHQKEKDIEWITTFIPPAGWVQVGDTSSSYRRAFKSPDDVVYKVPVLNYERDLRMQRREVILFKALDVMPWIPDATLWEISDDEDPMFNDTCVVAMPFITDFAHKVTMSNEGSSALQDAAIVFEDLHRTSGNYMITEEGGIIVIDGGNVNPYFTHVSSIDDVKEVVANSRVTSILERRNMRTFDTAVV